MNSIWSTYSTRVWLTPEFVQLREYRYKQYIGARSVGSGGQFAMDFVVAFAVATDLGGCSTCMYGFVIFCSHSGERRNARDFM